MAKIFVICGHGAGDSGACGNGYTEAERVRALGKKIKALGGSNVLLGDVNRNYYADNGISSLTISKDYQIVELHMDSSDASSAKGGHVIIKAGFRADSYDIALANLISGIFPGRADTIVERSNLANPNRAAARGYGYRLIECGFISNANDVRVFNSQLDDIAKGILKCFGLAANGGSTPAPAPKPPTTSGSSFKVRVSINDLNIRKGPGTNYGRTGQFTGVGVFTITEVRSGAGSNSGWGRLKSGAGWISLDYATRV